MSLVEVVYQLRRITKHLKVFVSVRKEAFERLVELVYDDLRRIAHSHVRRTEGGETINTTALVHEAYLRLVGDQAFESKGHFFASAADRQARSL